MHIKDAITTKQNVTLSANWRYRGSRYKRIQLYRTDLHKVSGPILIELKISFRASCLFLGQIVIFRANFIRHPNKMPSRTPMVTTAYFRHSSLIIFCLFKLSSSEVLYFALCCVQLFLCIWLWCTFGKEKLHTWIWQTVHTIWQV